VITGQAVEIALRFPLGFDATPWSDRDVRRRRRRHSLRKIFRHLGCGISGSLASAMDGRLESAVSTIAPEVRSELLAAAALPPREGSRAQSQQRDRARLGNEDRTAARVRDADGHEDAAADERGKGEKPVH
jgi:hypothetical protein